MNAPARIDQRHPINWRHPLNEGLVSDWTGIPNWGGGGTVTRDLCRRNNGTFANWGGGALPTWSASPYGFGPETSVSIDKQYVNLGNAPNLNMLNGGIFGSWWYQTSATPGTGGESWLWG